LTLTQKKKNLYISITAATLLFACITIISMVSAQTYNPQQPPDFGNFNGTMPDFGGNMSFPGDFNGSQGSQFGGGRGGDGNFTRPDFSGAPNQYDANNGASTQAVTGSQTDYTWIIVGVVAVVGVVVVSLAVSIRKKKSVKPTSSTPAEGGDDTAAMDDST
jgi:hypothetical protein